MYDKDFKVVGKHLFGWTHGMDVVPGSGELRGEFKFASSRLYLQMKGGGTLLLFR